MVDKSRYQTMSDDPIQRLRLHLEKHQHHQQVFVSTAGLAVLLTRLALRDAQVERLTKERDDIHTLWLKCCSNSVALVHQHDELKAQVERLTYELDRWKEVDANKPDWEKLWEEQSEKVDTLTAQVERLIAKEGERISKALVSITCKDGGEPCGECHIQPGETCDICGATNEPRKDANGDPDILTD